MKNLIITFIYTFVLTFISHGQTRLYVSPNGDGNFTQQSPGNISQLTNKVRGINSKSKIVTIELSGGLYKLQRPIVFNNYIVGNISRIELQGTKGEEPVISGGISIKGWSLYKKGIYKASVPQGIDTRQIYVNGKIAIRARTPNRQNDNDYGPYFRLRHFNKADRSISINSSDVLGLYNPNNVEMVVKQHWFDSHLRINSMKPFGDSTILSIKEPEAKNIFALHNAHDMLYPAKPYYLENSLSFLDAEGEWYLDNVSNVLYYKPRLNENISSADIIIPTLENLIRISGTPDIPLKNISINNIQMCYSTWLLPNKYGNVAGQGVMLEFLSNRIHIPGIIDAKYVQNLQIDNCGIYNCGGNGIVFDKGVNFSKIIDCHIHDICANGIVLNTFSFKPRTLVDSAICIKDTLKDNLIEQIGINYTNGMGIIATGVSDLLIDHNEIRYVRYSGLQIGGFFGDTQSIVKNNIISNNNIHHVMLLHDDGGAIYTLGNQIGTKIYNNYIHDIVKSKWADGFSINTIYLDNSSAFIQVEDNVFDNLNNVTKLKEQNTKIGKAHDNKINNFESFDKTRVKGMGVTKKRE
ncbi:hypothetical protein SNE25_08825 [Mucilaginibacter sabulilitoris]|uniref:GH141-like insertion domain-containing protein n=1 Tax=Mucilaginibacter sabulilitoris TaxID=1173583 RepID=A0ABZ0TWX2_9SPHI|nr:hypothetical protein [Mucilaginibacter sabulilitoris]WPU95620.1 hypothetical protein SNE25_08825 [Mucilaginibacter sabulilitoris]